MRPLLIMAPMTREQWLTNACERLNTLFKAAGHELPRVRLSVGFPGGGSAKKRIGEYWSPEATSDQVPQIFISPIHRKDVETLGTLVHELVHACVGSNAGDMLPNSLKACQCEDNYRLEICHAD